MQSLMSDEDLRVLRLSNNILPLSAVVLRRVQTTLMNMSLKCHIQGKFECYGRRVHHGMICIVDACSFDNDVQFQNITLMEYTELQIGNNTPGKLINLSDIPLKIVHKHF